MKKYESYLNSPFKIEGISEKQYITKEDENLWETQNGDLYVAKKISKNKRVINDSMVYTKLFVDGRDTLMKLSGSALKILMYGMCSIRPLSKVVIFHTPDVKAVTGFASDATVRSAICELIEAQVIAQKLGSTIEFWINPNIFFNGNRIRLMQSK
jgi:hypothetical protein